jgi:hypothetical protein
MGDTPECLRTYSMVEYIEFLCVEETLIEHHEAGPTN